MTSFLFILWHQRRASRIRNKNLIDPRISYVVFGALLSVASVNHAYAHPHPASSLSQEQKPATPVFNPAEISPNKRPLLQGRWQLGAHFGAMALFTPLPFNIDPVIPFIYPGLSLHYNFNEKLSLGLKLGMYIKPYSDIEFDEGRLVLIPSVSVNYIFAQHQNFDFYVSGSLGVTALLIYSDDRAPGIPQADIGIGVQYWLSRRFAISSVFMFNALAIFPGIKWDVIGIKYVF